MSVAKKVGYRCRGERQFCMMVTRTGLAAPPVIEIAALFIPALRVWNDSRPAINAHRTLSAVSARVISFFCRMGSFRVRIAGLKGDAGTGQISLP
jgi:hypothetical protein